MNLTEEQYIEASNNMVRFGGGFVKALGQACLKADSNNRAILKRSFPEYFKKYMNF